MLRLAAGIGALIVLVHGCGPTDDLAGEQQRPVHISPPATGLWRMERDSFAGRLDADTRARHDLPAGVDSWGGSSLAFREDFEDFHLRRGSAWYRLGIPEVQVSTEADGNRYVTLTGVPRGQLVGFARDLPASVLAGRAVLCQVKTRLSNPLAARRLGMPVLEFLTQTTDGAVARVPWPLADRASPGWELQQFVWSVPADLERVALRIVHDSAVAGVWFDDLVLRVVDPTAVSGLRVSSRVGDNILAGGDFETGIKRFIVTDGEEPLPAVWHFATDAAVGGRSLFVPLRERAVRVAFGPVVFARTGPYVLTLQAKGSPGVRISGRFAELPEAGRLSPQPLAPRWQQYERTFQVPRAMFGRGATLELRLEPPGDSTGAKGAWLDAVALTRGVAAERYGAPNECELGLVDLWDDPLDLARVLDLEQPSEQVVLCVNYAEQPRAGVLAIDVTDGLDRVVRSQTVRASLPARGLYQHALKLRLPRGYYRILATLWPGPVGQGQPLSQAERSLALVYLSDAVPRGAPCGLNVAGDFCSQRLTQLGFGWIRWRPGDSPGAGVRAVCEKQALEVLLADSSAVPTDTSALFRSLVIGVERRGAGELSTGALAGDVAQAKDIADLPIDAPLVEPPSDTASLPEQLGADSKGPKTLRFAEGRLPETIDPAIGPLQAVLRRQGPPQLWDVATPVSIVSNYVFDRPVLPSLPPVGSIAPLDTDPAWEASLAVRRFVLRLWAGVARVCFEPVAPGASANTNPLLLSEYDHSPTPLVAAIDYMNELLNTARPVAWFDLRDEVRVLCFDTGGAAAGPTVGIVWRPFGSRPTWIRLAGVAGVVDVRNLFGSPAAFRVVGRDLLVPASGFVLYLLCPAESRAAFVAALGEPAGVLPAPGPSGR